MTHKKKLTISKAILKIIMLVPTLFSVFSNISVLIGWEARRAGKSIAILLLLSIVAGSIITTIWLCLLAMLFLYLISLHWSEIQALLCIALLNAVLLIIIGIIMSKVKNNLSFPAVRRQLQIISQLRED
jgi:hypothetical protein